LRPHNFVERLTHNQQSNQRRDALTYAAGVNYDASDPRKDEAAIPEPI
jgi:hypothetical protein